MHLRCLLLASSFDQELVSLHSDDRLQEDELLRAAADEAPAAKGDEVVQAPIAARLPAAAERAVPCSGGTCRRR